MTDWLVDTLIWTAGLIALVLLLRRPVARWFGPQTAYALWALPALRLILPPLELPAWLNPAPKAEAIVSQSPSVFETISAGAIPANLEPVAAAPDQSAIFTPFPFLEIGIALWLVGAVIFLIVRFGMYFRLRGELLEGSREVGRSGKIKMIETPGAEAPLALGVIDPMIVLPAGFMANPDRASRDLAIAHELAHHEGCDLFANIMVQPLFALHWFTPLARYGWLAMRRDQEAACDARVMASKPAEERATYADLIAGFAAGPNVTLAAPMACPVLGEKSIIHRLRSLSMSEISNRRRNAGRALVAAAVIALPLTASISYAESDVFDTSDAVSFASTKVAPAAPLAPRAPLAPQVPTAPLAPLALQAASEVEIEAETEIERETDESARTFENTFTFRETVHTQGSDEHGEHQEVRILMSSEELSDEEIEELIAEVRTGLAEADAALEDSRVQLRLALAEAREHRTDVRMECRGNSAEVSSVEDNEGGGQTVFICQSRIMAHALEGLREAREALSTNSEISGSLREQLLETLDEQLREWERREQS
ncbi:MAG: M56 family metallopeptidase [Erythrobacter sp.]